MACSQLGAFADGELSLSSARLLMDHLDGCAICRADLDEMRATSGLLRELHCAPPRDLGANIRVAARSSLERHRKPHHWAVQRWTAAAWPRVAAMLVGAACVSLFVSPSPVVGNNDSGARNSSLGHLMREADGGLGLDGSFRADIRSLSRMPEGRLIAEMADGR